MPAACSPDPEELTDALEYLIQLGEQLCLAVEQNHVPQVDEILGARERLLGQMPRLAKGDHQKARTLFTRLRTVDHKATNALVAWKTRASMELQSIGEAKSALQGYGTRARSAVLFEARM